jgi:hypothetical protein
MEFQFNAVLKPKLYKLVLLNFNINLLVQFIFNINLVPIMYYPLLKGNVTRIAVVKRYLFTFICQKDKLNWPENCFL